jgi:hypothetical protein
MAVFWVVAPHILVEVYRRFRGAYSLHHQGDRPETLVNFYQTTRCYNPEDSNLCNKVVCSSYDTSTLAVYLICDSVIVQT